MTAELGIKQDLVCMFCDNQSATHLGKNQMYHKRKTHIDVKLHFIRDEISKELIKLEKIHTSENATYMLTKPLPTTKFRLCLDLIGVGAT